MSSSKDRGYECSDTGKRSVARNHILIKRPSSDCNFWHYIKNKTKMDFVEPTAVKRLFLSRSAPYKAHLQWEDQCQNKNCPLCYGKNYNSCGRNLTYRGILGCRSEDFLTVQCYHDKSCLQILSKI